jgi:hypothetical protein
MPNTLLLKKSAVANSVPTAGNLQPGELALNYTDGNLFYKNASNVVTVIASNKAISLSGNITGGNINTAGLVSVTGDIFGKELWSTQSSGDEGGQVNLGIPATNTSLTGQVTIDIYQNKLRFFQGDNARGAYIDLTQAAIGVGTNLLAGGGGGTPGGANTQVQFNDGGLFGGNAQFTYNKVTNLLTVGNISANSNGLGTNYAVGDDAWIGDINLVNTISIRGQQNAANGYIVFGNADSTSLGRAGSGPLTYAGAFSATGNITGGNIVTAGLVTATGNVSGNYFIGNGSLLTGITTPTGYFNSTLTTYPTGDYGNGEAFVGAVPSMDSFGIMILPNFDDIDPQGSYVTVDLN